MYLTKSVMSVVAIATLFCSPLFAQDLQLSQFNAASNFPGMAKQQQPGVNSLPSDFFSHDESATADAHFEDVVPAYGNALVLVGFALMLGAGGVITGLCIARRKKHTRPAAVVKMFA